MRIPRAVLFSTSIALAACGGGIGAAAIDADGSDAGAADDASLSDAASADELFFGGPYDSGLGIPDGQRSAAQGACDPPCAAGEYCYANVTMGGGRGKSPLDPLDASSNAQGCNADPSACGDAVTCACLLEQVGRACHLSTVDCVLDDAGRPTVRCIIDLP
jgi:hypothetical protein